MNIKPILFNTDAVHAILDGRKTVTRQAVTPKPLWRKPPVQQEPYSEYWDNWDDEKNYKAPCRPGDILYVRETWCWCPCWDCGMDAEDGCCDETADKFYNPEKKEWGCYGYKASFHPDEAPFDRWIPSIYMPREVARIFLRVTDVRVERLHEITEDDAIKEGCTAHGGNLALDDFEVVWRNTVKSAARALYGWEANPWVWVIEFERISKEEAIK